MLYIKLWKYQKQDYLSSQIEIREPGPHYSGQKLLWGKPLREAIQFQSTSSPVTKPDARDSHLFQFEIENMNKEG